MRGWEFSGLCVRHSELGAGMHPQAVAELQFCGASDCGRWEAEWVELAGVGEAVGGGWLAVAAAGQGPKPALEVS